MGGGPRAEPRRLVLPDAGESAHSLEQIALHGRIHREQQHGFAARGPATQLEGAYVDSRLAKRRAETADEARLVVVDGVEHVALNIGLQLDAQYFYKTWCAVGEQRASQRAIAGETVTRNTAAKIGKGHTRITGT